MDYVSLNREEWSNITALLTNINRYLETLLSAPHCSKCGSRARNGKVCGYCGAELFKEGH